jgi:hypothetical protein
MHDHANDLLFEDEEAGVSLLHKYIARGTAEAGGRGITRKGTEMLMAAGARCDASVLHMAFEEHAPAAVIRTIAFHSQAAWKPKNQALLELVVRDGDLAYLRLFGAIGGDARSGPILHCFVDTLDNLETAEERLLHLLQMGADPNERGRLRRTVLHRLVRSPHGAEALQPLVRRLLQAGARPDMCDAFDLSARTANARRNAGRLNLD